MVSRALLDFLIVGSGLTGSVIARQLTDAGASCLIVEKRNHPGGNVYDESIGGVRVHTYGPHIFHTDSIRVWTYVNRFANWIPYEHRVKAHYEGKVYSFPPNLLTYDQIGISPDDPELRSVLFELFFRGYSQKQWGRSAEDVPYSIIKRIPVRFDYDDRYFSDKYQALPVGGYTAFIHRILAGINVELNTDYLADRSTLDSLAKTVIYTGPIDSLYGFDLGRLEYRSLRFETEVVTTKHHGLASMNYTDSSVPYTRVHNWKYFGYRTVKNNVLTTEYPIAHDETNEPYYPVNDEENNQLYQLYAHRAKADGIISVGRLGSYRYYDMHQAIGQALATADKLLINKAQLGS